jgi:tRNA(fMet)-specific endonuclease VapC
MSRKVIALLDRLAVMPLEPPADLFYAEMRAALERAGTPIGHNDMLIAAHALAFNCTLVTNNEREFHRVKGLKAENWLR